MYFRIDKCTSTFAFHQHFIGALINTNYKYQVHRPAGFLCSALNGWMILRPKGCLQADWSCIWPTVPAHSCILGAVFWPTRTQRPANDVSDRNWGDGGGVGVISDEKVINFHHSPNLGLVVSYSPTITNPLFLLF